jgi:hypothetical protein
MGLAEGAGSDEPSQPSMVENGEDSTWLFVARACGGRPSGGGGCGNCGDGGGGGGSGGSGCGGGGGERGSVPAAVLDNEEGANRV